MKKNNLPIFPLGIVALPGTIQHLQIFEPRYLKMVKDCMSKSHGFVIVFQKQHSNTDDYEISKKGSYVEIIDFNSLPNGLLGITVKSLNKVIIKDLTQLEDGLHIANTHPLIDPEVDDQALILDPKGKYQGDNIFQSIDILIEELIKKIKDYDIILIMTNKDSQKFIQPILQSLEEK